MRQACFVRQLRGNRQLPWLGTVDVWSVRSVFLHYGRKLERILPAPSDGPPLRCEHASLRSEVFVAYWFRDCDAVLWALLSHHPQGRSCSMGGSVVSNLITMQSSLTRCRGCVASRGDPQCMTKLYTRNPIQFKKAARKLRLC